LPTNTHAIAWSGEKDQQGHQKKNQKNHDKQSIIFLYGLNSNICKEAIELDYMSRTGVFKLLGMKKTLKFKFRLKFHDF
jgi:hypothetical protein